MKYLFSTFHQLLESLKLSRSVSQILELMIAIIMLCGSSCKQNQPIHSNDSSLRSIPIRFILKADSRISIKNDVIFWKGTPYSGYLYELDSVGKDTLSLEGFVDGQLNGDCKKWYPNNQLMEVRSYSAGHKHGKQVAYWANGNKRFEFMAINDAYEGEMKEWSEDGKLFHLAHFKDGQEEGVQKLWYENGKIRANYVIVNGKRYGLLGTKNCKNVSDSIFIVK